LRFSSTQIAFDVQSLLLEIGGGIDDDQNRKPCGAA